MDTNPNVVVERWFPLPVVTAKNLLMLLSIVLAWPVAISWAETPQETLARFRTNGGACCISGRATALTVGGDRWHAGNAGVGVLRAPLPKPISILNVKPIDGAPLTDEGITLLAAAQKSRAIRFYAGSVNDRGVSQLVEALNAGDNLHRRLEFHYAAITDEALEPLTKLKHLTALRLIETQVSVAAKDRLVQQLPECKIEYRPHRKFAD